MIHSLFYGIKYQTKNKHFIISSTSVDRDCLWENFIRIELYNLAYVLSKIVVEGGAYCLTAVSLKREIGLLCWRLQG